MKKIYEYLGKPTSNNTLIKLNDNNVRQSLLDELKRVGTDADLNRFDVSEVTKMEYIFEDTDFSGDVSKWNVSNLTNALGLFKGCKNFNSDLSRWDVRNLKYASEMFSECENFNQDLSRWQIDSIETAEHMFFKCYKFNSDLSDWNVSKCKKFAGMFYMCKEFTSDLSSWEIQHDSEIYAMFYKCSRLDFKMVGNAWENYFENSGWTRYYEYALTKTGFRKNNLPKRIATMFKINK